MDSIVCIQLPFLLPGGHGNGTSGIFSLWPGHGPVPDGAWQPDDYPLPAETAFAFLNSMAALSLRELEVMRHMLSSGAILSEIGAIDEMAALSRFTGADSKLDRIESARIQAQKTLLWRWQLEKDMEEISRLEAFCQAAEASIPLLYENGENQGKDDSAIEQEKIPLSWRPLVANAAIFIPPSVPILAAGEMADDLADILEFSSSGQFGAYAETRAPLWLALGHSRPASGTAAHFYNVERIWLTERN